MISHQFQRSPWNWCEIKDIGFESLASSPAPAQQISDLSKNGRLSSAADYLDASVGCDVAPTLLIVWTLIVPVDTDSVFGISYRISLSGWAGVS